jgi:hypothetical protein
MTQEIADFEAQLEAMRAVMQALKPLDEDAREAVLTWVDGQVGRRRPPAPAPALAPAPAAGLGGAASLPQHGARREGTVNTVAQKIGVKSARELLLAAATFLMLFQGRESFTKDELIACAKEARAWKAVYSNQMANNIKRMLDAGTLFEKAKDIFSLSEAMEAEMQAKLAV